MIGDNMKSLKVLDCTLRDGGYCNQWKFGQDNISRIINGLDEANIDIIECGFITNKVTYNMDASKFTSIEQFKYFLPSNKNGKLFVSMMNYGEFSIDDLPEYDGSSIDGVRIAFHKKNRYEALKLCEAINAKGYKTFIQPMVSVTYTDIEFIEMINIVNKFKPYAFYIVDSFGMMKNKDLLRLYYMVENNLDESIRIGFHSHNNMQLAYSNALSLINNQTNRELIIDSSIYGMGRGAGNLNTELFVEYLNDNYEKEYKIKPLLRIIDEILNQFYHENYWGYSLPNYLSAKHNAHPNYAGYLSDKNTLTFENIDEIFEMMPSEKKVEFDKNYIEQLYVQYLEKESLQTNHGELLKSELDEKTVLLIAPGKSSQVESGKIRDFANREDVVSISVNFNYDLLACKYIFISNLRRFKTIGKDDKSKCIVTSNIPFDGVYLQVDYKELLNGEEFVSDNAGLMAIRLLISFGVKEIFLAGFDGYSHEQKDNYLDDKMAIVTKNAMLDSMNEGMNKVLNEYNKLVHIQFLTTPKHLKIGD